MDFKNVEKKYRPIPFWSWNEKLDIKETARQIDLMDKAGMGGFFMHARGGLQTGYMSDEWFDNVEVCTREAKKRGMQAWAYDENGWPSGSANGEVCKLGKEYCQKYLRMEKGEKHTDNTICNYNGYHFYYEVNEFYIDVLNPKAVAEFIKKAYVPYYERYGSDVTGFFTDEPQMHGFNMVWSFEFPEEYKRRYGEDLLPRLLELFIKTGDYKNTRVKFWKMATDLFSKSYAKQIYDYCSERGLKFTGHINGEESLFSQMGNVGSAMPHYEYFHIPGIDWLGRNIYRCLTPYCVGSAAAQTGKKQVLTESYALCGHNVSFGELKSIYEWQMMYGVNLLCQHLQGYSIRGIRKRDYPPAMYIQQPWWNVYKYYIYAISLESKLFCEGKTECNILLLLPMTTVWSLRNADNSEDNLIWELNDKLLDEIDELNRRHLIFHLGDETLIERHGRIEKGKFIIGCQSYDKVIRMPDTLLLSNTEKLLNAFKEQGGTIYESAEQIDANDITDNPNILYTKRVYDDCTMHFFLNITTKPQTLNTQQGSKRLDILTGTLSPFDGHCTLLPNESAAVFEYPDEKRVTEDKKILTNLTLDGEWNIKSCTPNALTLDRCDYYFDGELVDKDAYVLDIQTKACGLGRKVNIRCDWTVDIEYIPEKIYLGIETPDIFKITINGAVIDKTLVGTFIDNSIKTIDISKYLNKGTNTITTECDFEQSEDTYDKYAKCLGFEGVKNRFSYDMEIEPIYIVGDFAVIDKTAPEKIERNAERMKKGFAIGKMPEKINLIDIQRQGFRFFAGSITLTKTVDVSDTSKQIELEKKGINAVKVKVNNGKERLMLWEPLTLDISGDLKKGENEIEITLTNNLRNLMGPHHLEEGESYNVGPASFYRCNPIWKGWSPAVWNDDYCFVETGIKFK